MKKQIIIAVTIFIAFTVLFTAVGFAQGMTSSNVNLGGDGVDDNIGLEEIRIPIFGQPEFLKDTPFYSIFSWIAFGGLIFSIGLVIFWIALIVRAAFQAVKSEGQEEGLGESFKRVQSVFVGIGIALLVPILISLFGAAIGLGPLWDWPAGLRDCPGGSETYFFQQVLSLEGSADDPVGEAEEICFASESIGGDI